MNANASTVDWDDQLAQLLAELSDVQGQLLDVLGQKRDFMAEGDVAAMQALQSQEEELGQRLEDCHRRRGELLAQAQADGLPAENLGELAKLLPSGDRAEMGSKVKEAVHRTRLLQHESLANWVLAQRSLLHVSQMLEIIATGGRIKPTYGINGPTSMRGSLVDQEA